MTLKELIKNVDKEAFTNNALYQQILAVRPEFGSCRTIHITQCDETLVVTNVHLGSLGDIVAYPIDVEDGICISNDDLLCAILSEMMRDNDSYDTEFWNEMTNLQKAKLLR